MPKAALAQDEEGRLAVLQQYRVLDTVAESTFDEIVKLAASICDTPVSLLSFVDRDRQWFKASVGTSLSETSRDISFCAHAILQEELLFVPDACLDERFADNPAVTGEPGIRFYAGVPLVTRDGYALGTLCVADVKPRELTQEQLEKLQALASAVMLLLEVRRFGS